VIRAAAVAIVLCALVAAAPEAVARDRLDIRLFTRVGPPGQPEPVAIGPDGLIYVGTNQLGRGDADAPSRIFVFSRRGRLVRSLVLRGQDLEHDHGIQGLAFDGRGLLYALDRAERDRVVVLDPRTGAQRDYATFADVPPCSGAPPGRDCSATVLDQPAAPDYGAFAPDGSLYVTDIEQALVWRVPKGGGRARVWLTHPHFESIFGPNGIQLRADGRTLLMAVTAVSPAAGNPTEGRLYDIPIRPDGRPGAPKVFWRSRPVDGPDGFALARSGNVYLALAGSNQIALLSPSGEELGRAPATPAANLALEVPVDAPASAAFLGDRVLVTNHSAIAGNPRSWAVLDVFAGERGLPLFKPVTGVKRPRLRPRIRLTVRPRRIRAGKLRRYRFRATVRRGGRRRPLRRALIRFARRRVRTNRRGRASLTLRLRRLGRRPASARRRGYRAGRTYVRVLRARR
jgi:SMP-30/Gluconolactonase/LRE-like region